MAKEDIETTPGTRFTKIEGNAELLSERIAFTNQEIAELKKTLRHDMDCVFQKLDKTNGVYEKLYNKVDRKECHTAQVGIELKIKDSEKAIKWFFAICTILIAAVLGVVRIF